jgi:hypothetical protein
VQGPDIFILLPCVAGFAAALYGLIGLLTGQAPLTHKKSLRGAAACLLGLVCFTAGIGLIVFAFMLHVGY